MNGYSGNQNSAVSGANTQIVGTNSSGHGVNNFLYGMHSFRSAEEVQYYLNRMAGPESQVTIRNALHLQLVPSTRSGNEGLESSPQPRASPDLRFGSSPGRSQISSSSWGFTNDVNGRQLMTPPNFSINQPSNGLANGGTGNGNRRNIILFCELYHPNSTNGSTSNSGTVANGGYAPAADGVEVGYCQICQSWMMQSGERSITFPPPQP